MRFNARYERPSISQPCKSSGSIAHVLLELGDHRETCRGRGAAGDAAGACQFQFDHRGYSPAAAPTTSTAAIAPTMRLRFDRAAAVRQPLSRQSQP